MIILPRHTRDNIESDHLKTRPFFCRIHLLMRGPGITPGSIFPYLGTQVDIAPTWLGLAGLPKPSTMVRKRNAFLGATFVYLLARPEIQKRSFAKTVSGQKCAGNYDRKMVCSAGWQVDRASSLRCRCAGPARTDEGPCQSDGAERQGSLCQRMARLCLHRVRTHKKIII